MSLIIDNPHHEGTVDMTGWNLEAFMEIVREVGFDANQGNDRPLTEDEIDYLGLGYREVGMVVEWWTSHHIVNEALIYWRPIVEAGLLYGAWQAMAAGQPLTPNQRSAYDEYVRELAESPQ